MASLDRRNLIVTVALGMGTLLAAPRARAQAAKASKKDAAYQDHPMDIRMCATCSLFDAPKSCRVVEGEVSPKGWCNLYALAD